MAKQEDDFELLAALEASEVEGKTKENEMRIAQRLTSAHEKKSGNRFVDGERDGNCLPRSVLYADGKLACVDLNEEKNLIQEQRAQSNNDYVAALDKYGLVNYVTKAKNYSLRTDGTVHEHSLESHPEYSALKFVDGASDDECLVAMPTENSR
jgi:hypothetical protein